jgi:signal transduction histidine kinase
MSKENSYRLNYLLTQLKAKIGENSAAILDKLDDFPVGIAFVNSAGVLETVNQLFCQIFHAKRRELLGQEFQILFAEQARAFAHKLQIKVFDFQQFYTGKFKFKGQAETDFTTLGATFYVLENQLTPQMLAVILPEEDIPQAESRLVETLMIIDEYTEELRQELNASKTAEELILSHLHKPLNNIIDIAQMMIADKPQGEELVKWLKNIQNVSIGARNLLDRFSTLQRIEKGDFSLSHVSFDLLKLIEELQNKYIVHWRQKKLGFDIRHNGRSAGKQEECRITADRTLIKLMLSNLIINAIEASPEGETIKVEMDVKKNEEIEELILRIHNQGAVSENIRENFFEKFTTLGNHNGLGFGTYIARSVVRAHNGSIDMETNEKEGTTLRVTLPVLPKYSISIQNELLRKHLLGD